MAKKDCFIETGLPSKIRVHCSDGFHDITSLVIIALLASKKLRAAYAADPNRAYSANELLGMCSIKVSIKSLRRAFENDRGFVFQRSKEPIVVVRNDGLKKVFLFSLQKDVMNDILLELEKIEKGIA